MSQEPEYAEHSADFTESRRGAATSEPRQQLCDAPCHIAYSQQPGSGCSPAGIDRCPLFCGNGPGAWRYCAFGRTRISAACSERAGK